jgi:hypothetical protein
MDEKMTVTVVEFHEVSEFETIEVLRFVLFEIGLI